MKKVFLSILMIFSCLYVACDGTDDEPEEPACVLAEAIEIPIYLGCIASELPGVDQDVFQKLVIDGHPRYDTVYTRLSIDYLRAGTGKFLIRIDSAANLNLLCNALSSIDYPELWVTEFIGTGCQ